MAAATVPGPASPSAPEARPPARLDPRFRALLAGRQAVLEQGAAPDPGIRIDAADTPPVQRQRVQAIEALLLRQVAACELLRRRLHGERYRLAAEKVGRYFSRRIERLQTLYRMRRAGQDDTWLPSAGASWTTPGGAFPSDPGWRITRKTAAAWASHRFEGHFSERVLRLLGDPEGHPLFELRLDLLEYEVLFARFIGVPHHPRSGERAWIRVAYEHQGRRYYHTVPAEEPLAEWDLARIVAKTAPEGEPQPVAASSWPGPWEPVRPKPWAPPEHAPADGSESRTFLLRCLQLSCRDYAEGLALYLTPGREHWGGGPGAG